MAFALSASTSKFVGAKVTAKPTVARRQARYEINQKCFRDACGLYSGDR